MNKPKYEVWVESLFYSKKVGSDLTKQKATAFVKAHKDIEKNGMLKLKIRQIKPPFSQRISSLFHHKHSKKLKM